MQISINNFQDFEASGVIKKKDLEIVTNLKKTFKLINQHLYGKLKHTDTGTRARSQQIIFLLLCKLIDEKSKDPEEILEFQIKEEEKENKQLLLRRIQRFFEVKIKSEYREIFEENDKIKLNKELVFLIVRSIQRFNLHKSSKDILSDAYEIFVSKSLKEEGGQFFTPSNVIEFMVNYINPELGAKIIDPACGHGGFLLETKNLFRNKIKSQYKPKEVQKKEFHECISNLYGIDKDSFFTKISKLYLDLLSGGESNIFCEDSLDPNSYHFEVKENIMDGKFDYIFTNPPFGAKIPIDDKEILRKYKLAHVWKNISNTWKMQNKLLGRQPPQILFIERCVQLLKNGGKLGIILPDGIFGNPSDRYIWEYLDQNGQILGIVSLDQNSFQPYTSNKTSILFYEKIKKPPLDYSIDFAIVDNIGHDKDGKILYKLNNDGTKKKDIDGNPIINDELIDLDSLLKNSEEFNYMKEQKYFKIKYSQIKNNIFIPSYYIGVEKPLKKLANNKEIELFTIKELIDEKIIYSNKGGYLPRGNEIGSHVYGLGNIPFIRTSELFNWEINLDSNKKTSLEVYKQYKDKQNIEKGDIILVKDGGSNHIGKTAFITELDTKIIIQSHIFQIKTLENKQAMDSYLLLYLLNLDIVQKQIQAITFIQGTLATIGNRIMDIILPIPKEYMKRKEISDYIKEIINKKTEIRKKLYNLNLKTFFN